MIIRLEDFRLAPPAYLDNSLDYRHICGNAVLARQYDVRLTPNPELPQVFDDFNARAFIERVYGLATQI